MVLSRIQPTSRRRGGEACCPSIPSARFQSQGSQGTGRFGSLNSGKTVVLWFYPRPTRPAEQPRVAGTATWRRSSTEKRRDPRGVLRQRAGQRQFRGEFDCPYRLLCDTERRITMATARAENDRDRSSRNGISYVSGPDGTIRQRLPQVDARRSPSGSIGSPGGDAPPGDAVER